MAGKISILVGLPRSGKSTFARSWLGEYDKYNRVVTNGDNVRLALTNQRYNEYIERHVHAIYLTMVKALVLGDNHVLCDDTHTTWHSIIELLYIDPNATVLFHPHRPKDVIELQKQMERSIGYARSTNQEDLIPVIARMTDNLDRLIFDNFDRKLEANREIAKKKVYHVNDR
jgi:GTPase SAR1 family protein